MTTSRSQSSMKSSSPGCGTDTSARASRSSSGAERDSLTGLLLRRAFGDAFARMLAHSRRGARPLSLALLDIDHFKS